MAYTFDAGPNCFLLLEELDLIEVKEKILIEFNEMDLVFYEEKVELN